MTARKRKEETPQEQPQPAEGVPAPIGEGQPQEEQPIPVEGTPFEREFRPPETENLQRELEEARAKSVEYLDGWQRAMADFANYKRRIERDQAQAQQNATASVVRRYLEIVDDLDRALKKRPQDGEGVAWAEGVELIYRKLLAALEAEGVKTMSADGQYFDPNLHEAITQEDSPGHQSGQIIEVVQPGYMLGERVIRPARVRVAR